MAKRLYRNTNNQIIFGVASGIGDYFEIDPNIVRLVFVLLATTGSGVVLYLIAAILLPTINEKKG